MIGLSLKCTKFCGCCILRLLGIKSRPLCRNYNRKQFVSVNNAPFKKQNIICGVPQGSVLGPLLFSIYINDLPKASNFETRLFADNTALFLINTNLKSLSYKVNMELSKVDLWLNTNKLTLNHSKSNYLLIKTKSKPPDISYFNVSVRGIAIENAVQQKI